MKTRLRINNLPLATFLFFGFMGMTLLSFGVYAASDSVQVKQDVVNCNNNGICEAWESFDSCPEDCSGMGGRHRRRGRGRMSVYIPPDMQRPGIYGLTIEPSINSVQISWTTDESAIAKVYWGRTQNYEEASLSEVFFSKNHAIKIENLLASSRYFFKISVSDTSGNESVIRGLTFVTLAPPDTEAPANVSDLRARVLENSILLTWKNPRAKDFAGVRVTKREKFFPRDFLEGKVVYEGKGTRIEDREVKRGVRYYYSVFSRDKSWNYSSGANVSALLGKEKVVPQKEIIEKKIPGKLKKISLFDFDFIQEGKKISFAGDRIKIRADKNLKISLDAKKVPEGIKKISLELKNPERPDESFLFMLGLKKDKGVFETVVSPIAKEGSYPLSIFLADKKNKEIQEIKAEIVSVAAKRGGVKKVFKNLTGSLNVVFKRIMSPLINAFMGIIKLFGMF